MGKIRPQNMEKRALWRLLFPILASFLLIFLPGGIQLLLTYTVQQPAPTCVAARVDLSSYERIDFQNSVLLGEIEFYPNAWIVSEPDNSPEPVPFQTPGLWAGYPDGKGGTMGRDGYGSYRFMLTGLKSGSHITPVQNIDAPCRVYLNGELCFRTGNPSKTEVATVTPLYDMASTYVTVPANGCVEYVMEVGNTGVGGVAHIALISESGAPLLGFATRVFAPFATGAILAIVFATAAFIVFSPRRKSAFALVGLILSVGVLYLFSHDSLIIGLDAIYGGALFGSLSLMGFAASVICLLLYGLFVRNPVCSKTEFFVLVGQTTLAAIFIPFTIGSKLSIIPIFFMVSSPLLMLVQSLIFYTKGRGNLQFIVMSATMVGYGLTTLLFSSDFLPLIEVYHPTIFAGLIALEVLASAFLDILHYSITRRDNAILDHRLHSMSNRALAYLATDTDILQALHWLGNSYEESIALGDRRLVNFTSLLRRRIMTLREESISLSADAEIESSITELQSTIKGKDIPLLLDIDHGDFQLPPLIFEGVIAEISKEIKDDEVIVLSDYRRAVRLVYPSRITLSDVTTANVRERCLLLHRLVSFRPGSIVIYLENL